MHRHRENYLLDIIKGRQKGIRAFFLRQVLFLFSIPYRMLVACRNWAFDHGWLRRYFPPVPVVISIGNIVIGGTGKTPATIILAQEFYRDFLVAILSRGYRSQAEKLPMPIILSKGKGPLQSAAFCGDEPFLIAQNLPETVVIVGKNRHKASDMAAKAGAHLILLDDGMQHRRLARDFEVIILDHEDPFGQGHFLPRGLLREGVSSLARADLLILNHVPDFSGYQKTKQKLARFSKAPVVGTRMEVDKVLEFNGEPVSSLNGIKVGIFCGIARPEYFYKTVAQEGAIVVDSAYSGDHMVFSHHFLVNFAEQCKALGAELLLCTEKDKVKIVDHPRLALPVAWIKMRLKIVEGESEWQAFVSHIKHTLQRHV